VWVTEYSCDSFWLNHSSDCVCEWQKLHFECSGFWSEQWRLHLQDGVVPDDERARRAAVDGWSQWDDDGCWYQPGRTHWLCRWWWHVPRLTFLSALAAGVCVWKTTVWNWKSLCFATQNYRIGFVKIQIVSFSLRKKTQLINLVVDKHRCTFLYEICFFSGGTCGCETGTGTQCLEQLYKPPHWQSS